MNKLKAIILITLFLLFSGLFCFILDLFIYTDIPASSIDHNEKLIIIKPGQNFKSFSESLQKAGIIKDLYKFNLFARIKRYDKKIKAGEYLLSAAMPPNKIFHIILSGKVRLYKLTIPEGYNLNQIASNLATPEKIISAMVKRFRSVFTPAFKEQAKKLGLSIHQTVTLASIIEKETGDPEERSVISSVFHNRLKKKMRLESDPTVIYGIKDFDGNIKKTHLKTSTPYNTYQISGLPPGPIANPGKKAIEAALFPADTDFLYFVSKKDNTHMFSTNIRDHNKAVRKYQLRK